MKAVISKSLNILNSSLYVVSASSIVGLNFRFFGGKFLSLVAPFRQW